MKVLIVGATGTIGSEALDQCLLQPHITSVVSFTRRTLSSDRLANPKLKCIIIENFHDWSESLLEAHVDAAAMIWTMGTYDGNTVVDMEYPIAFQKAFVRMLERHAHRPKFRYIHLSGRLTEQNQSKPLCLLPEARKIKGLHETRALAFAKDHTSRWQTLILRPGAVLTAHGLTSGMMSTMLGHNWSIRIEELATYMAYLAVGGEEDGIIIENARMVEVARALAGASAGEAPGTR
ncbi:hypothetical protein GQ53DRAFT_863780 [Thozetella sp. PMI_491]|nr:hypothetical protein GQ53DRAFT_863780 [Thozetella sp. PMI_491]